MSKYNKYNEYESACNPNLPKNTIFSDNINNYTDVLHFIDQSQILKIYDFKCTSPELLAGFISLSSYLNITINNSPNECENNISYNNESITQKISFEFNSTSNVFYIFEGHGIIKYLKNDVIIEKNINKGDVLLIPNFDKLFIEKKSENLKIYFVNDNPLLNYIEAVPKCSSKQKFTIYEGTTISEKMVELSNNKNNRKGIIFSNEDTENIGVKTISRTLWTLFNEVPPNTNQKYHKHNSIALDFCIYAEENKSYTIISNELDENNSLLNPAKVVWKSGEFFITPPGMWHSHHNEGSESSFVLPIQNAGLLTHERILGIVLEGKN